MKSLCIKHPSNGHIKMNIRYFVLRRKQYIMVMKQLINVRIIEYIGEHAIVISVIGESDPRADPIRQ